MHLFFEKTFYKIKNKIRFKECIIRYMTYIHNENAEIFLNIYK